MVCLPLDSVLVHLFGYGTGGGEGAGITYSMSYDVMQKVMMRRVKSELYFQHRVAQRKSILALMQFSCWKNCTNPKLQELTFDPKHQSQYSCN